MNNKQVEELKKIFDNNKDKRILVIGTTCTGKSTLIKSLGIGLDMDKVIFPLLIKEESDFVCQTPWTKEIGEKMTYLVKTKLKIRTGEPLFGTVLVDCDLIIYLHISDELLKKRTDLRNVDFINAKNMQTEIEEEIKNSNIKVITLSQVEKRQIYICQSIILELNMMVKLGIKIIIEIQKKIKFVIKMEQNY